MNAIADAVQKHMAEHGAKMTHDMAADGAHVITFQRVTRARNRGAALAHADYAVAVVGAALAFCGGRGAHVVRDAERVCAMPAIEAVVSLGLKP